MHPAPGAQGLSGRRGARRPTFWTSCGAARCIPRGRSALRAWAREEYWGGSSNASTQLLDDMHYRGLLRVKRRDSGTRVMRRWRIRRPGRPGRQRPARAGPDRSGRAHAPAGGQPDLSGAPSVWRAAHGADPGGVGRARTAGELPHRRHRLVLARRRTTCARALAPDERLRLLAPFDPWFWDRRRFTLFWDWTYKLPDAAGPRHTTRCRCSGRARDRLGQSAGARRQRGAGVRVIGWANLPARDGSVEPAFGYVAGAHRGAAFRGALDENCSAWGSFSRRADAAGP